MRLILCGVLLLSMVGCANGLPSVATQSNMEPMRVPQKACHHPPLHKFGRHLDLDCHPDKH
jgi:hypothetical protein